MSIFLVVANKDKIQQLFSRASTTDSSDWLDSIVGQLKVQNIGEYLNNQTWYFNKDGSPWLVDGIGAFDIDPARTISRTVSRFASDSDWFHKKSVTVTEKYIKLGPTDPAITVQLNNLNASLYSLYIYGTVDAKGRASLNRVWLPLSLEFALYDSQNNLLEKGLMPAKQGFNPRVMQEFNFHTPTSGNYHVSIKAHPSSQETAEILFVKPVDQMNLIPNVSVKQTQNIDPSITPTMPSPSALRLDRDKQIWDALPSLNYSIYIGDNNPAFLQAPASANIDNWDNKSFSGVQANKWPEHAFDPLEFVNSRTGEIFNTSQILNSDPLPGALADYGNGIYLKQADYPSELISDIYYLKRSQLLGQRYLQYVGTLESNPNGSGFKPGYLADTCRTSGNSDTCEDAALALVRFAYDWPALQMSFHDEEFSTQSPDLVYNTDWSTPGRRNGKYFYDGWSGANTYYLLLAYDNLFPFIKNNTVLAQSVHRFIPWVNSPADLTKMLDRYIGFSSSRDFNLGLIRTNSIDQMVATVLGPDPTTFRLMDFTKTYEEIYPTTGTTQESYAKAFTESGIHYIGSTFYGTSLAYQLLSQANELKSFKDKGYLPIMDLSDINKYPKIKAAGDFLINRWTAGGYQIMFGDASGGTHDRTKGEDLIKSSSSQSLQSAFQDAYTLTKEPKFAWVLKNLLGNTNIGVVADAAKTTDPILFNSTRYMPQVGAVIESGTNETDIFKKGSLFIRTGLGQGHAHEDYLDLNLYGLGLPMAVDLAQRDEADNWTRPSAKWSFLHNHALASDSLDPSVAGNKSGAEDGEPYLKAFTDKLVRGHYENSTDTNDVDRDVFYMDIDGTNDNYVFDLQKVKGGSYHTWAFHGAESDGLQLNTSMNSDEDNPWLNRLLENTRKSGTVNGTLQATWTMSRIPHTVNYTFNYNPTVPSDDGVFQTKSTEQFILGNLYDSTRMQANVRASLIGHSGDKVMQGDAYSDPYEYDFPFLWVQSSGQNESVYPAIYETYRGNTPLIKDIQQVSLSPLDVKVTTQTGQEDEYVSNGNSLTSVSKDSSGKIRWAKLSGGTQLSANNINITSAKAEVSAKITDIDYNLRKIKFDSPLPANSYALIGNSDHKMFIPLKGPAGKNFTFDYDIIVNEGSVTNFASVNNSTVDLSTNQDDVLFTDKGNRNQSGFTSTNESGTVHFRNKQVIKKPAGTISQNDFSDTNGDGFVDVKTYEFGIGDTAQVLSDVTVKKNASQYQIMTNVPVSGNLEGIAFNLQASDKWQNVNGTVQVLPGDANSDSHVDGVDYLIWMKNYGKNLSGIANADFNNDSKVDKDDYLIWQNNFVK